MESLEATNIRNRNLLETYGEEECDRRNDLTLEIKRLKEEKNAHCNHFDNSLAAIQQFVRKLSSEVMIERNKLRLLSTQHLKLRNILVELTGKEHGGSKYDPQV